jgi:hypothetical protein
MQKDQTSPVQLNSNGKKIQIIPTPTTEEAWREAWGGEWCSCPYPAALTQPHLAECRTQGEHACIYACLHAAPPG